MIGKRVYAVKGIGPFSLGQSPVKIPARVWVFRGETGVNGGEGLVYINFNWSL